MESGQVAIVTGASSGLGRELAVALAKQGTRLVLAARGVKGLEETAKLAAQPDALILPGDLSDRGSCQLLIQRSVDQFGRLDHLVLCAGLGMWARLDQVTDPTLFERLIAVNYLSAVYCTHAALSHLRQSQGLITVISSLQGRVGVPLHTGYAGAKHALHGFFDSLRMELEAGKPDILMVLPHWIGDTALRQNAVGPAGAAMGDTARRHGSRPLPAAEAARLIVEAMEGRKRELVLPRSMKSLLWLNRIAPGLAAALIKWRMGRENG
ncbi:MAG TPA: SDR family oxidoreductase [Gemmatimonadales bacterium]|nr:SDR family oxidoreductase [Gemmatimonadales bacterium]